MFLPFTQNVPSIKTPTFFVFSLNDKYQTCADGILEPDVKKFTPEENKWMKRRQHQTRAALELLKGVESRHGLFLADCFWHIFTKVDVMVSELKVKGYTFNDALG